MLIKINKTGEICIPKEYLQKLQLQVEDEIEIFQHLNEIVIRRPTFMCVFCGSSRNVVRIGEVGACRSCIERLYNAKIDGLLYPKI